MVTVEERLDNLEKKVEKQAFQLRLVQQLAADYDRFGLFDQVLAYDLSEKQYQELRELTSQYTDKIKNGEEVSLHNFTEEFKRILKDIEKEVDFEKFISLWLKGPEEGFGFSKASLLLSLWLSYLKNVDGVLIESANIKTGMVSIARTAFCQREDGFKLRLQLKQN